MEVTQSEIVAIRSVEWLAGQETELHRFLALTGMSLEQVRSRINDADFLGSVLDFILESESRLLAFCNDARLAPEAPMLARQSLPGGDMPHWT